MDDYLAKPVGIPALVQMLGRWLPHTLPPPASPVADLAAMLPQAERPAPVDEAVLAGLTHGDPVETRELLDDFLASTSADLVTLEAAKPTRSRARPAASAPANWAKRPRPWRTRAARRRPRTSRRWWRTWPPPFTGWSCGSTRAGPVEVGSAFHCNRGSG
jgi:hypothetical protein